MTELAIRHATPADAGALARLLGQLGYPAAQAELPPRLDRFSTQPNAAVLVACRGRDVVGVASVHVITPLHQARDVAWLTALVIDEGARRQGVGQALVGAAETFARDAGCERLSVTTHVRRADAHAFYEGIGFELTGRRYGKALHTDEIAKATRAADPFDLERFVRAQEGQYERALAELRRGRKTSHWMWYVFPQLAGLGQSPMSVQYAIAGLAEAEAYLRHPLLGPRLVECAEAVLGVEGLSAHEILGDVDARKLHSSATLFAQVATGDVFDRVIERYFAARYDDATMRLLAERRPGA